MDKLVAASAVIGGMLGLVVAGFLICFLFGAVALWLGGKILGIPGATGRASVKASLIIVVVTFTLPTLMSILPVVGTAFGGVLSLVLSVVVVQQLFEASLPAALFCILFKWFLNGLVMSIASMVAFGSAVVLPILFGVSQA